MMPAQDLTLEQIESTVARAREERAEAIRTGAASLGLILKHFLTDLRHSPARV